MANGAAAIPPTSVVTRAVSPAAIRLILMNFLLEYQIYYWSYDRSLDEEHVIVTNARSHGMLQFH